MDEQKLDTGVLIVIEGDEAQYEQDGKVIQQIPAWKWFLGHSE